MKTSASNIRILYWVAAGASAVALILGLVAGSTWSRLLTSAALAVIFGLQALYPVPPRPAWATAVGGILIVVALGLMLMRLFGQLD